MELRNKVISGCEYWQGDGNNQISFVLKELCVRCARICVSTPSTF